MKQKYQILPRKYRPQKFCDVVGQEAIVTTLKNAIRFNRTAYAYLFSGSRGIGKTTIARLFAKTLNCHNLSDDFEPCCECISCKEISSSRSLDIMEIDGASNRGIDDIRQINETLRYSPNSGKYKIYIIDEVHMLTKEAFNALLKTLEEPPVTIKFFFATTEPHKVPSTILSRTQRFDLLRISQEKIIKKLENICVDIERKAEKEALHLIAHFSEGSLRDAESLLDQLLCYEKETITASIVNNLFGCLSKDHFFQLDKAVENNDCGFAFVLANKLFQEGKDFSHFIEQLLEHYRQHLIIKLKKDSDVFSFLSKDLQENYLSYNKIYHEEQLFFIIDLLIHQQQSLQKSPFKQASLEMTLLQIIRSSRRIPIQALLMKLKKLEDSLNFEKKNKSSQIAEKTKIELAPIPFSLNNQNVAETNTKDKQNRYDTLIHFAAIELEGTIKK